MKLELTRSMVDQTDTADSGTFVNVLKCFIIKCVPLSSSLSFSSVFFLVLLTSLSLFILSTSCLNSVSFSPSLLFLISFSFSVRIEHCIPEPRRGWGPQGLQLSWPPEGVPVGHDPATLHITVHQRTEMNPPCPHPPNPHPKGHLPHPPRHHALTPPPPHCMQCLSVCLPKLTHEKRHNQPEKRHNQPDKRQPNCQCIFSTFLL